VLFRPVVLRYIRGSAKSKKRGVQNFVGVALFQSRVLMAPSSANFIRHYFRPGQSVLNAVGTKWNSTSGLELFDFEFFRNWLL